MIDFAKITKTLDGMDCRYLGQRTSGGQVINRFAVFKNAAELFCYYNEQGQQIDYVGLGKWVAIPTGHQIIAPPKVVEVTRWVCFMANPSDAEHPVVVHLWDRHPSEKQIENAKYFKIDKHTWNIEVPND